MLVPKRELVEIGLVLQKTETGDWIVTRMRRLGRQAAREGKASSQLDARYARPRAAHATAVTVNGSEGTCLRQCSRSVARCSASRAATCAPAGPTPRVQG